MYIYIYIYIHGIVRCFLDNTVLKRGMTPDLEETIREDLIAFTIFMPLAESALFTSDWTIVYS